MKSIAVLKALFIPLAFLATAAAAHGPTPQKVEETVAIAAPPARVWDALKSFGDIAAWHPELASSKSSDGDKSDAIRTLVFRKGGELEESLDEHDDANMTYSYRLKDAKLDVLPVSFYSATIDVKPGADGGSTVEWFGRFYRGDTGNFPPDELNDEAAVKAMTAFMKTGLAGLKARVEANKTEAK
ncbi:SRPBCC family protein [Methylocella sp.]|uniref:SRPBCC family protein n=1 Tax=Methylocella sp. TaxID=1978226 RepID=UPI0037835105